MNKETFSTVIAAAKAKAVNSPAWLKAIDRAVTESPAWIVTEHVGYLLITSASGETYRVNGHCNCKAGVLGKPCKHLAYRRLRELAEAEPVATKAATTRSQTRTRDELIADIKRTIHPFDLLARFHTTDFQLFATETLADIVAAIA